jgi:hypothetical protein
MPDVPANPRRNWRRVHSRYLSNIDPYLRDSDNVEREIEPM